MQIDYRASAYKASDFEAFSTAQITAIYNDMVADAHQAGASAPKIVSKFETKAAAIRRTLVLHALVVSMKEAAQPGLQEAIANGVAEVQEQIRKDDAEAGTPSDGAIYAEVSKENVPDEVLEKALDGALPPARTRLIESGKAEELRETVVADQKKAMKEARLPAPKPTKKKGRRVLSAGTREYFDVVKNSKVLDSNIITYMVPEIPAEKLKDPKAVARWNAYEKGITVLAYRTKVGRPGAAAVAWDLHKGWIKIK